MELFSRWRNSNLFWPVTKFSKGPFCSHFFDTIFMWASKDLSNFLCELQKNWPNFYVSFTFFEKARITHDNTWSSHKNLHRKIDACQKFAKKNVSKKTCGTFPTSEIIGWFLCELQKIWPNFYVRCNFLAFWKRVCLASLVFVLGLKTPKPRRTWYRV